MPLKWIEYKGHQVLYSDYRGLSDEEMTSQLMSEQQTVLACENPVLLVHNIDGVLVSRQLIQAVKDQQIAIKGNVAKSAVLGITGMLNVFLAVINRITGKEMKSFEDEQDALDWLIGD